MTTAYPDPKLVSDCHNASMSVVGSGEGTNHYECDVCKQPCNFHMADPKLEGEPISLGEMRKLLIDRVNQECRIYEDIEGPRLSASKVADLMLAIIARENRQTSLFEIGLLREAMKFGGDINTKSWMSFDFEKYFDGRLAALTQDDSSVGGEKEKEAHGN